jgi:hypothetical protein
MLLHFKTPTEMSFVATLDLKDSINANRHFGPINFPKKFVTFFFLAEAEHLADL